MEIRTLENVTVTELLTTFNEAFSDYLVKFELTEQQLNDKMQSEGSSLIHSVGMFDQGRLVGFMLLAFAEIDGKKVIYNGGTGVIPSYRGKGITQQLYQYAIHYLAEQDIKSHLLEFIKGNTFAQRVYESVGFKIVRELDCLRGPVGKSALSEGVTFKELKSVDWNQLKAFFTIQPSWQNNIESVVRATGKRKTIGCYVSDELVGFACFNPENGRIALMAIDPAARRKGYGSQLLSCVQQQFNGELSVFNVDKSHTETHEFFKKKGLQSVVEQYEMILEL